MILMVVTPFILSTGIYNINNFMDNTIYQQIMMGVKNIEEAMVSTDLSVVSKGTKISNIPIALASAMATALIPGISSDFAQGYIDGVKKKVAKSVKVTMMISIPCAVGIGVLSKPIMRVIFPQPSSLDISSILLSCMAVSIIFYALSTLTQAILQSIGKMNTPIINASVAVVLHAVIMILLLLFLDEKYSLYYYVFSTVLYSFILCILNQISVHRHLHYSQELYKTFASPILASVLMGVAAFAVYHGLYFFCKINLIALAVAIAVGAAVYFILIIRWKAISEEELLSMPKGYMLLRIARKTGIMKAEDTKKSSSPKKKKIRETENRKREGVSFKNIEKQKNNKIQNKAIKVELDEMDDDYWLDE